MGAALGSVAGSLAGPVIGGLMGGASSQSSGGPQTVEQVPWAGVQPYMVGDTNPDMGAPNPLSSDWLQWHFATSQGAPYGPASPMFVNDPRYTGENVYDAPFNYQRARLTGPGYGQDTQFGAPPGGGGGLFGGNEIGPYPSEEGGEDILADVSGDGDEEDAEEEKSGGLSEMDLHIIRQARRRDADRWAADPEASVRGLPHHRWMGQISSDGRQYVNDLIAGAGSGIEQLDLLSDDIERQMIAMFGRPR